MPKPIWLIKSGGVKIAATTNAKTIAYFLLLFKSSLLTKPALYNSVKATGIWKAKPNAYISFKTKDRYSLTFASNSIAIPESMVLVWKPKKNLHANGKMK